MKRNGGGGAHYQNVLQTSPQDGIPKAGLEGAGKGEGKTGREEQETESDSQGWGN